MTRRAASMKLTLRLTTLLILAVGMTTPARADSAGMPDVLGARYAVSVTRGGETTVRHLTLWRSGNRVLQEIQDRQIAELWELTANGGLHLVRYFDAYQRGIEYLPGDFRGEIRGVWEQKHRLLPTSFLEGMTLESERHEDAFTLRRYATTTGDVRLTLDWLAEPALPRHYVRASAEERIEWQLVEMIGDTNRIRAAFAARESFQTTDYADIGDNESDPFLVKMINLGFIEHGSEGIYDTAGRPVPADHAH